VIGVCCLADRFAMPEEMPTIVNVHTVRIWYNFLLAASLLFNYLILRKQN